MEEDQQIRELVHVFRHRIEGCGADSLVSDGRLPETDGEAIEITCQGCRRPYRVRRSEAIKTMSQEEARAIVSETLRAQGHIEEEQES